MIEILPESNAAILVVKASKKLTAHDYESVFIPAMDERIKSYGKIRVVFYLDENFTGWDFEAMWDDAKFGMTHRHDFEKIAVITEQKWMEWATNLGSHFIEGQVKTYPSHNFKDAINWAST